MRVCQRAGAARTEANPQVPGRPRGLPDPGGRSDSDFELSAIRRPADRIVVGSMGINMMRLAKSRFSLHKTASAVVVVLYLSGIATVDLLHNDECQGVPSDAGRSIPATDGEECPGCRLLVGHHSTQVDFAPTSINAYCPSVSQLLHHVTIPHRCQWGRSIASRAPPLVSTS